MPAPELLTAAEAADALGIRVSTLYDWLGQSDTGTFVLRSQPVTIAYYQGGRRGQGRIRIDRREVERLLGLMAATPHTLSRARCRTPTSPFQHITTPLGRPD